MILGITIKNFTGLDSKDKTEQWNKIIDIPPLPRTFKTLQLHFCLLTVHGCTQLRVDTQVWRSTKKYRGHFFPSIICGMRIEYRFVQFGSRCLYLLRILTGPADILLLKTCLVILLREAVIVNQDALITWTSCVTF